MQYRSISLEDGTVEALKWLALVLMTLDHINKYLLHGSDPVLFAVGRLALPLFSFVLAYNLARPSSIANAGQVFPRTLARLGGTAAAATVPFVALGGLVGGWWPLNVLAMLCVATAIMYLLVQGGFWCKTAAVTLFCLGGAVVEFWWPALAMCLAAWYYCRRPSWVAATAWVASVFALTLIGWAVAGMPVLNAGMWGLLLFPLIFAAQHVSLTAPRLKWFFYAYFPGHLAALWAIAHAH